MTIQSKHMEWYNELLERCKKTDLTRDEWHRIGGEMHTLYGDYGQYGYDYEPAKEDLSKMWAAWKACEPPKEEGRP